MEKKKNRKAQQNKALQIGPSTFLKVNRILKSYFQLLFCFILHFKPCCKKARKCRIEVQFCVLQREHKKREKKPKMAGIFDINILNSKKQTKSLQKHILIFFKEEQML